MRLIDADALIKDIDGDLLDGIAEVRAIEKIENAPTVGGWISVKDRLPDDASDVLAYYDDSECETRIAPVNYYKGVWYDCVFNRPLDTLGQQKITHWMSLPEPPKE